MGSGAAAYYVAVEVAADTVQSLSHLTGVIRVQTNDYLYLVYFQHDRNAKQHLDHLGRYATIHFPDRPIETD